MMTNQPPTTETTPAPPVHFTRRFAFGAALVVVIAAAIVAKVQIGLFERQIRYITRVEQGQLSRVITNDLWELGEKLFPHASTHTKDVHAARSDYRALDAEARRLIAGTRAIKVMMIGRDGIVKFSTNPDDLGKPHTDDPAFQKAIKGEASGEYKFHERFNGVGGPLENVWVVSSYVPGRVGGTGTITGVAEIYTDITQSRAEIHQAMVENVAVAVAALVVVYLFLLGIVWSAERVLRAQHARALKLAAAMARAETADRAKSEFLANMSHELRTPLNAIIGFSEIMANEIKGPLGDPSYKGYVTDINDAGQRLLGIIDKVLDLVRAENGTGLLEINKVNVAFIAKSVGRMLSKEAEDAGVSLDTETESDPLFVETDANKLREILLGLTSNGIRFTPRGGRVALRVARKDDGTGAVITITDTGVGMGPEDVTVAEAPFGHVDNVYTKARGGIGLGLPFSRKLTELIDGTFEISSAPGKGTVITLILPDRPAEPDAGRRRQAAG